EAVSNRIFAKTHDDRNGFRRIFRRLDRSWADSDDGIWIQADQFFGQLRKAIGFPFGETPVDKQIFAFDISRFRQNLRNKIRRRWERRRRGRSRREKGQTINFLWLLRLGWSRD